MPNEIYLKREEGRMIEQPILKNPNNNNNEEVLEEEDKKDSVKDPLQMHQAKWIFTNPSTSFTIL